MIAITNPATGEVLETFVPHTVAEVEERIASAHAAVAILGTTTIVQRREWMRRAADILEADIDFAAVRMTREMGKTIAASRAEVEKCARAMRFYADHAEEFLETRALKDPSAVGASAAHVRYEPLGVVLAVMPWNYPLWQVIRFAAPALMAGNSGLLKHASNVPSSALYLETLFARSGFPEGSFRTLLIGARDVEKVIVDPRVQAVTLTGSEPAGRAVAATAGAHVKKTVLELGGSDPFIVLPSADVEQAAAVAVVARTANNGQACISAKRFIVHTDVIDRFRELFVEGMRSLVVGDPEDPATQLGPVATKAGLGDLRAFVDDAVAHGAKVLTGGHEIERPGWYFAPTVIEGITEEMRLRREETFGPLAALYEVANVDEALTIANETDFGLSSSVWTRDAGEQAYVESRVEAGAVFFNGMTASYPELPFGGIKNSGYGRELAADGMLEFCNIKTVWRG